MRWYLSLKSRGIEYCIEATLGGHFLLAKYQSEILIGDKKKYHKRQLMDVMAAVATRAGKPLSHWTIEILA